MRLLLLLPTCLAAGLTAATGPVRAQATADQLNKLSLEALTAPPPHGSGGGYAGGPAHPAYHPPTHSHYATGYHAHGYHASGYHASGYHARSYHGTTHVAPHAGGHVVHSHAQPVTTHPAHRAR